MADEPPKQRHPRDSAFSFTINNPDDGTPTRRMIGFDAFMLIVTDRCTYRMQLADEIDPKRTNPALPPVAQQKLFDHGAKSDILRRSLFLAHKLFREGYQPVDVETAIGHTLEAVPHLIAMHDAAKTFRVAETDAITKISSLEPKDKSLVLPAVGDVRGQCKAFIQRADHCSDSLLEIARLFEPGLKASGWGKFLEIALTRYGADDQFCKFLAQAVPLLQLVLDARDCFEHQRPGIVTNDFAVRADGNVLTPTISIDYRKTNQPPCSVLTFMEEISDSMLVIFEMMTVHLCAKHLNASAGVGMLVYIDRVRENSGSGDSSFCYWIQLPDGTVAPFG